MKHLFAAVAAVAVSICRLGADLSAPDVEKWDVFEIVLSGPADGNPYLDVELEATFAKGERVVEEVHGFYDGAGSYKIRFMPDEEGAWTYQTLSTDPELDGASGSFTCVAPTGENRGPVEIHHQYHFKWAAGGPYYPFGTTVTALTHQPQEMIENTFSELEQGYFNKLRMAIFPQFWKYNRDDPVEFPFENITDYTRPNPAFWARFEENIERLCEMNIIADVNFFHSHDNELWGYANMGFDNDVRYVKYAVARLSAYRNVWWCLANEFDLMMPGKSKDEWTELIELVRDRDPYDKPRGLHNGAGQFAKLERYDMRVPWLNRVCAQDDVLDETASWRAFFQKPFIWEEVRYEGDQDKEYGDLTGEELTDSFWKGVVQGAYVTHGEMYSENANDILWWTKGNELKGTSPARIRFFKELFEQNLPDGPGLDPIEGEPYAGRAGTKYYLYYYPDSGGETRMYALPAGVAYLIDVIDTWNMTITPYEYIHTGATNVTLPNAMYQAVQIRSLAGNTEPIVHAGTGFETRMDRFDSLDGDVADDGLPSGPATALWEKVSGPGRVTFVDATDPKSPASYSEVGSYVLRLTGNDGALSASDEITVVVHPSSGALVASINFNGEETMVEGTPYQSFADAQLAGLTMIPPFGTDSHWALARIEPWVDDGIRAMLLNSVGRGGGGGPLSFSQALPNGAYTCHLWFYSKRSWENTAMDLFLEGQLQDTGLGGLAKFCWEKRGPYYCTVDDGTLDVVLDANGTGDNYLCGMSVFRTEGDRAPALDPRVTAIGVEGSVFELSVSGKPSTNYVLNQSTDGSFSNGNYVPPVEASTGIVSAGALVFRTDGGGAATINFDRNAISSALLRVEEAP